MSSTIHPKCNVQTFSDDLTKGVFASVWAANEISHSKWKKWASNMSPLRYGWGCA